MTVIRMPTPLRPFAEGKAEVQVASDSVAAALRELVDRFPGLRPHLYGDGGELRPYINLFVNEENIRSLNGEDTPLAEDDRLMILPSIAGGSQDVRAVDHNALRTNQGAIIALLLAAYLLDAAWIVAGVGGMMWTGTAAGRIGFMPVYWLLRRLRLVGPDVVPDHPEPHRFSQGLGAIVLLGAVVAFLTRAASLGWGLSWLVIALASLNLFGGFCVGCAMYYWFNRLGLPGFAQAPPPGTTPGRRPQPPVE